MDRHQALTSQGALLGQHDEVLSQVLSLLWKLSANVALLLGQCGSYPAPQATAVPWQPTPLRRLRLSLLFASHMSPSPTATWVR